jgi:hypothetical protein
MSMNRRVFFWSLTSALAGFLFGFDTVVISGAEKTIQSLWGLSPGSMGLPWLPLSTARSWVRWSAAGPPTASAAKPRCSGSASSTLSAQSDRVWQPMFLLVHRRSRHRRSGHRHLHRGCSAVHFGDCASQVSRTTRGHVSVQHRFRHPDRLRLQRAARRHRRKCVALDAGRGRVPLAYLLSASASAFLKVRAGF